MKIFNRWGNLVFESTDPVEGWDGTYKGEDQGIDSYIYLLDYIGADGNEKFFKGNLTLIR